MEGHMKSVTLILVSLMICAQSFAQEQTLISGPIETADTAARS